MDSKSISDPVEPLYDARIRGSLFITTTDGERVHMHGGCWGAPCSHAPPRFMVAFPGEFEDASLVEGGGRFAVSIVSRATRSLHDRYFEGTHHIDDIGRDRFRRAPSGCPVLTDGAAYIDCRLVDSLDLGDFVLAIGEVEAAAVLDEDRESLTVNEIVAEADPRGGAEPALPYEGFDYDTGVLDPAPAGPDRITGERLETVHNRREWGLYFVSAEGQARGGERRGHFHIGCWSHQTSHDPPRMVAALHRDWEGAEMARRGGRLSLSLLARDQLDLALHFAAGAQTPEALGDAVVHDGTGWLLPGAVNVFHCRVEATHDAGDFLLAVAPVEEYRWLNRDADNLTDGEVLSAAEEQGVKLSSPRQGFPADHG